MQHQTAKQLRATAATARARIAVSVSASSGSASDRKGSTIEAGEYKSGHSPCRACHVSPVLECEYSAIVQSTECPSGSPLIVFESFRHPRLNGAHHGPILRGIVAASFCLSCIRPIPDVTCATPKGLTCTQVQAQAHRRTDRGTWTMDHGPCNDAQVQLVRHDPL